VDSCVQSLRRFYDLRGELGSSHRRFNLDTNILNENADQPFVFGFKFFFFNNKKENSELTSGNGAGILQASQLGWSGPQPLAASWRNPYSSQIDPLTDRALGSLFLGPRFMGCRLQSLTPTAGQWGAPSLVEYD
jgi:hypothetical protein